MGRLGRRNGRGCERRQRYQHHGRCFPSQPIQFRKQSPSIPGYNRSGGATICQPAYCFSSNSTVASSFSCIDFRHLEHGFSSLNSILRLVCEIHVSIYFCICGTIARCFRGNHLVSSRCERGRRRRCRPSNGSQKAIRSTSGPGIFTLLSDLPSSLLGMYFYLFEVQLIAY